MKGTVLPVDISALVGMGVDEWQAQASWPVSEEEFSDLTEVVYQSYGELLDGLPDELRDVFLVDLRFVGFLVQYFHAAVVRDRSERASIAVSYSDLARPYFENDWNTDATQFRIRLSPAKKLLFRLREAIRRYRFNSQLGPLQRCLAVFQTSECWSIGVFDRDKREYLGASNTWVETPYLESFLMDSPEPPEQLRSEVFSAANKFLGEVCSRASILAGLELSLPEITKTWAFRLIDLYKQYLAVMATNRTASLVLVSGLGDPANRVMAFAAKRKGAHVVAFSHGNDACATENISQPFLEYAICNEFVSISQRASDNHAEQRRRVDWGFCSETRFRSLETSRYQKILRSKMRGQRQIKTVMLIGFPMHPLRYVYGRGDFFPFRLSAELDTARILRAAGYRVLYKPHPETQRTTSEIMAARVDEIILAPFEAVMDQADCFVFTYPITTTFGVALASNTPIVMLDHEGRRWIQGAYKKLKRRCVMVPTSLDGNGRNIFSETDLLNAITQAPANMDHSFLDEFMSPANSTPDTKSA
jgi:hypothetical protein